MLDCMITLASMSNHSGELITGNSGIRHYGGGKKLGDENIQDSTEWEYEEITIGRGSSGFGFTIAGGTNVPHYKNDYSIYITRFLQHGPAALDGRLKLEDIIVRVDYFDLTNVTHEEAVEALKNSGKRVQLLIKRRKQYPLAHENNDYLNNTTRHSNQRQQILNSNFGASSNNNNNSNIKENLTRLFSSSNNAANNHNTSSKSQSNSRLPPLPPQVPSHGNSAILRGSTQYSTTRESSAASRGPKLKGASSTQSLQHHELDELDSINGKISNTLIRDHVSSNNFSRSSPAIDLAQRQQQPTSKPLTNKQRKVVLTRSKNGLGFNILGSVGQRSGTFISHIVPDSPADRSNKLFIGDQILSVNGIDLKSATHEEAAFLLKQDKTVKLVVKYMYEEYLKFENRINALREKRMTSTGTLQTSPKRSLYARALFDYDPTKDSGLPSRGLSFKFGDILHVTNASDDEWWQARRVLEDGREETLVGIIPSKRRVEKRERARLRTVKFINRNNSESALSRRRKRFTFSKKFPFMKSRENVNELDDFDLDGSQSNSRILFSSTASINNNSERGSIRNDLEDAILSYEPVLQQEINYARPVALYGPIQDEIEALRDDLGCDDANFYKMESIVPYTTRPPKEGEIDGVKYHFVSMQEMKKDLARHKFVEAGELNNHLYGTSIESIREVAESGKQCLLNISPKAIKRLHEANIYPVIIFIKPKSIESLLEMNKRWSHEEAVKAMEQANQLEQEYGNYFTATIQLDTPNEILREVYNIVSQHSGPRIWIPTTFEALRMTGQM